MAVVHAFERGIREKIMNKGFRNINIAIENADTYFSNSEEMAKWIDQPTIVPFLEYLPDRKKKDFRNEVVGIMTARTKQPDGRCLEAFRRLNVKAESE
jgi:trans-aconitate methyltransferase